MYRGPVGVNHLNNRLQAKLNPQSPIKQEVVIFGQILRQGDKLMQMRNNYDKEIFNGDIGYLSAIDQTEQQLVMDFDGRKVIFDWGEADQLTLAYAISVHKSQGSEFTTIVIPVVTQHYIMLKRNLIYTAVTRAKKLCVLVGSRRALSIAVNNDSSTRRYSAPDWRLSRSS